MYWLEIIVYDVKEKRLFSRVFSYPTSDYAYKVFSDLLGNPCYPVVCAIGVYNEREDESIILKEWRARNIERNDPAKGIGEWKDATYDGRFMHNSAMMGYDSADLDYDPLDNLVSACRANVPGWMGRDVMPPVDAAFIAACARSAAKSDFKHKGPYGDGPYCVLDAAKAVFVSLPVLDVPKDDNGPYAIETISYYPENRAFKTGIDYVSNLQLARDIYALLVRTVAYTNVCAVGLYDMTGPKRMLISWSTRPVEPDNPEAMPPVKCMPLKWGNTDRQENTLEQVCRSQPGWRDAVIFEATAKGGIADDVLDKSLYALKPLPDKPVRLTVKSVLKA